MRSEMSRVCKATISTGQNKGLACTSSAKKGSDFCGRHGGSAQKSSSPKASKKAASDSTADEQPTTPVSKSAVSHRTGTTSAPTPGTDEHGHPMGHILLAGGAGPAESFRQKLADGSDITERSRSLVLGAATYR